MNKDIFSIVRRALYKVPDGVIPKAFIMDLFKGSLGTYLDILTKDIGMTLYKIDFKDKYIWDIYLKLTKDEFYSKVPLNKVCDYISTKLDEVNIKVIKFGGSSDTLLVKISLE